MVDAHMVVIAVGADHAGFPLKEDVKAWLTARGHRVLDFGTGSSEPVDYPDFARPVAMAVASGEADRGLLVCGTGIGMAMAANKVRGARAAACSDAYTARMSREHNDSNVLALGARIIRRETALEIVDVWLVTEFAGGRHLRRIEKLECAAASAEHEASNGSAG